MLKVTDINNVATIQLLDGQSVVADAALGTGGEIQITGSSLDETLTIDASVLGTSTLVIDFAGDGDDALIGPDQANAWTISGAGAGSLGDNVQFSGFESLAGGSANDTLAGPDSDSEWVIDGEGSGFLRGGAAFSGMEILDGGLSAWKKKGYPVGP